MIKQLCIKCSKPLADEEITCAIITDSVYKRYLITGSHLNNELDIDSVRIETFCDSCAIKIFGEKNIKGE